MRFIRLHSTEPGTSAVRNTVIDGIVIHYTATPSLPRVQRSGQGLKLLNRAFATGYLERTQCEPIKNYFTNGGELSDALALCFIATTLPRTASWHYCVASKPTMVRPRQLNDTAQMDVVEYIEPSRQAHHCGILGNRVNQRSLGIEMCYPGPISKKKTQQEAKEQYSKTGWYNTPRKKLGPDGVKRWYTPLHWMVMDTLKDLVTKLITTYPEIEWIAGHRLFAPRKRIDPDPPFDMDDLRATMFQSFGRKFASGPSK